MGKAGFEWFYKVENGFIQLGLGFQIWGFGVKGFTDYCFVNVWSRCQGAWEIRITVNRDGNHGKDIVWSGSLCTHAKDCPADLYRKPL